MTHFYNDLAAGCNKWYDGASKKFASDAQDFDKIVTELGLHKNIMMNYGKEEFHTVKGFVFHIADSFIDSQRKIDSVFTYFTQRVKFMDKRITHDKWAFQLKYSTQITNRCESAHEDVEKLQKAVTTESN